MGRLFLEMRSGFAWIGFILYVLCQVKPKAPQIKKEKNGLRIPSKKYKLGIFTTYHPTICGIAQFSANMIEGLHNADPHMTIEVFNIVKAHPQRTRKHGKIRITDVLCTPGAELDAFRNLAAYVKKEKFNGVLVNHEYYLISNADHFVSLVKLLQGTGTPVYTMLHTPNGYPSASKKAHVCKIARHSEAILVMSWKGKHFLHNAYGIPKKKIMYFPHGIKATRPNKKILKSFKIPADKFVIYSDGILHPNKGIERVIKAMHILKRKNKLDNIILVLAGMHNKVLPYVGKLQKTIDMFGLRKHVVWISKFLSDEEMSTLHHRSNIYITLFNEVIPTSGTLTYAMYVGDAIISTPYRYSLELLGADNTPKKGIDKKNLHAILNEEKVVANAGIIVPFKNPDLLANAILALKKNPALLKSLKRQAKKRVSGYSWNNVSARLAYYLKTKKNKVINPDPYHNAFLSSSCRWKNTHIVDFCGRKIKDPISDGAYVLYADPFVSMHGEVSGRKLKKLWIKARTKTYTTERLGSRVVVEKNNRIKLRKRKTFWRVHTPNIVFAVEWNKKDGAVNVKVVQENIYGHATGGLGASLRQKYDLTKDYTSGFALSKIGNKL
ncbi:hypothetical protein NECID01_1915 [Nematocida sp. AWRm77]|nr:hypothetical protein NECID01_1915 [Nematocida sp. AWRm77]